MFETSIVFPNVDQRACLGCGVRVQFGRRLSWFVVWVGLSDGFGEAYFVRSFETDCGLWGLEEVLDVKGGKLAGDPLDRRPCESTCTQHLMPSRFQPAHGCTLSLHL